MPTLLLHVIAAFVVLVISDRLFNLEIPLEHLVILSLTAALPDVIDKTLTGTRYPFHSLLVSGVLLLLFNSGARYYINSQPTLSLKYQMILKYLLLASISFLTHPILDLEGLVPLFYPLDLRGYQFDFQISIIQSIPPRISDLSLGFVIEPFDYDITYDHEGSLIATFDALLAIILLSTVIVKSLQRIKNRITLTQSRN